MTYQNTGDDTGDVAYPRTIVFRVTEKQWGFLRGVADGRDVSLSDIVREIIEAARQLTALKEGKI